MDGMPEQYKNMAYYATGEFKSDLAESEIERIKTELKEIGYTGMTIKDQIGMVKTFFDAVTIILTVFGVIALMAASIGIINTLFMAVQERTREIGLMKAMGLGSGKIFTMFSFEAVMLGFWGSALGVGVAFVAKIITNDLASKTFLKDLPGFVLVQFDSVVIAIIVLTVMLIAFLAGTLPARRAAHQNPIDALTYE
jgi:putative ABC transport system permease protein